MAPQTPKPAEFVIHGYSTLDRVMGIAQWILYLCWYKTHTMYLLATSSLVMGNLNQVTEIPNFNHCTTQNTHSRRKPRKEFKNRCRRVFLQMRSRRKGVTGQAQLRKWVFCRRRGGERVVRQTLGDKSLRWHNF